MKLLAHVSCCAAILLLTVAAGGQTLDDPNLTITTHYSGLSQPTGMRFLGSDANDFLAIEKATGQVKRVQNGIASTVLDLAVNFDSERGLLGIELDPDFATNNYVYLYYSDTDSSTDTNIDWRANVLSRWEFDGSSLSGETVLMEILDDDPTGSGPNHDGGPIRLGPNGALYLQLGDLNRDRYEQNLDPSSGPNSSQVGGIARLNPSDGSPAAGNPFLDHPNSDFHKWFAYGVRNGFGMAFDPVTETLWATENGPGSYDEINLVTPGQNSGWKLIMGPESRDNNTPGDLIDLSSAGSTYSDPEFSWQSPVGVTSIQFLAGTVLEGLGYEDAILIGDNNTGRVYLFRLNEARDALVFDDPDIADDLVADSSAEVDSVVFGNGFGVMTELIPGPDGALYAVSLSNGEVYRIVPEPATILLLAAGGVAVLVRRRRSA